METPIIWVFLITAFLIGWAFGRSSGFSAGVTFQSNAPEREAARRDWLAICEPIIHQLEVGAIMGGVSYNSIGAKALADLISDMATKLDNVRHGVKRKASKDA